MSQPAEQEDRRDEGFAFSVIQLAIFLTADSQPRQGRHSLASGASHWKPRYRGEPRRGDIPPGQTMVLRNAALRAATRRTLCRPSGAAHTFPAFQGLAPLAKICRCSAARRLRRSPSQCYASSSETTFAFVTSASVRLASRPS
jgi:hypothetical protein